jgi:Zn-dependent peptidase ImmA (M78 family)
MKLLPNDSIENLSKKFRSDNGLSLTEPISLKSLLRKLNILTIFKPLSSSFYGMSLQANNSKCFILINSENAKGRQHFSIAHELFHLFYDEEPVPHVCDDHAGSKSNSEKNANKFASALLMPQEGLIRMLSQAELKSRKIPISSILRIGQYFSVSHQALLIRLKSLSLISLQNFDELKSINVQDAAIQHGYDTSLYNSGNEGLVLGDFGSKARVLYEMEKISEGHYLELLNKIRPDEKS